MTLTLSVPPPDEPDDGTRTFYFGPDGAIPLRAKSINGEPWFALADLCAALDVRVDGALSGLDEDEKVSSTIGGPGNSDIALHLVSESGLYGLIMRSRKPEAKPFRKWVTAEVLPEIRKTGQYGGVPRTYAEALRAAADAEDSRVLAIQQRDQAWGEATRARAIADEAHEQIRRDAPKVGYVDHFVSPPEDACLVRALAKELMVAERRLYAYLVGRRRIFKDSTGSYQPYASWVSWFALRDHPEAPRGYNGQVRTTLYVTPVGKEGVRRMLARDPGDLCG